MVELIQRMEDMLLKLGGTYMLNHAKRTFHISKLLAEKEKIPFNERILMFSCYFHDISVTPPYRPEGIFDHALESSKIMPDLAKKFGFSETEIEVIIEAVKYHDKANMGQFNETKLVRNADGLDYLGYMAIARDFSKQPNDMKKAFAMIKKHRDDFEKIIELDYAKVLAGPRIQELDNFIKLFEEESFGLY